MMSIKIRKYNDEDEEQVVKLIKLVYKLSDYRDLYRWMNKTNPSGHGKIYLACDNKNIVGHYLVVPRRRKIEKDIIIDGEAVWAAVHPGYRKQNIFTDLGLHTLNDIQNEIPLCTGFPNIHAIKSHLKVGWHFFDVPLLKLNIKNRTKVNENTLVHSGKFEKEFDEFWKEVSKDYSNIIVRDAAYLNYRYQHKPIDYKVRVVRNKKLLGFVVLKKYFDKSHIVDILAKDDTTLSELLSASINFAIENKSKILSCIMMKDRFYYDSLLSNGFNDKERKLFIYHINREGFKMPKDFFITMGDCDIY